MCLPRARRTVARSMRSHCSTPCPRCSPLFRFQYNNYGDIRATLFHYGNITNLGQPFSPLPTESLKDYLPWLKGIFHGFLKNFSEKGPETFLFLLRPAAFVLVGYSKLVGDLPPNTEEALEGKVKCVSFYHYSTTCFLNSRNFFQPRGSPF